MKIKSLMLGSAAALVAVSGAQAADAIVVEPEPVEYVRVCDAYGSGFFYIPGTETCMRLSGYVRSTYYSRHIDQDMSINGVEITDNSTGFINARYLATVASGSSRIATSRVSATQHRDQEPHFWGVRGRLNIDVRNETEWGTLRSQLRFQGGDSNAQDTGVAIDRALISVGGFRLGYSDSFLTTHHGYGYHRAINDGSYFYQQAIFFDYTWAANGFSITAGVQDSESAGTQFNGNGSGGMADFYVGAKYSASWGNIAVSALHDSHAWDEVDFTTGGNTTEQWKWGEGAWVYKASFDWDLSEYFAGGGLRGWYIGADSPYTGLMTGHGPTNGAADHLPADHAWGISLQAQLYENLNGYVGYSAVSGNDDLNGTSFDSNQASLGVVWAPITGLTVQAEYTISNSEFSSNVPVGTNTKSGLVGAGYAEIETDVDQFTLRITRSW